MRGLWKRCSIWLYAAVIAGTCLGTEAFGDSHKFEPILVFRIVNDAQVPDETLEAAREYAQHVYERSGIHIEWIVVNHSQPFSDDPKKVELTIVLVRESFARNQSLEGWATGFALSNDGQGARRAFVFADRAAKEAFSVSQKKELSLAVANALILGHVIAHEAGHLMLPGNAHSEIGIMKSRMDLHSVDEARCGWLLFTKGQASLIRAALLKQTESR